MSIEPEYQTAELSFRRLLRVYVFSYLLIWFIIRLLFFLAKVLKSFYPFGTSARVNIYRINILTNYLVNSSAGTSNNQKSSGGRESSQTSVLPAVSYPKQSTNSSGTMGKEVQEERWAAVPATVSHVETSKLNDVLASNHSVVGVSSSSDPVHVPSAHSRSAAAVGTIRRGFGAVGVRRQYTESSVKPSSAHSNSVSTAHLGKDGGTSSKDLSRPSTGISKSDHSSQTALSESAGPGRTFSTNQYNSRPHQQVVAHQKGRLIELDMLCQLIVLIEYFVKGFTLSEKELLNKF